jgi:hypothetical protein
MVLGIRDSRMLGHVQQPDRRSRGAWSDPLRPLGEARSKNKEQTARILRRKPNARVSSPAAGGCTYGYRRNRR